MHWRKTMNIRSQRLIFTLSIWLIIISNNYYIFIVGYKNLAKQLSRYFLICFSKFCGVGGIILILQVREWEIWRKGNLLKVTEQRHSKVDCNVSVFPFDIWRCNIWKLLRWCTYSTNFLSFLLLPSLPSFHF